jgi:hypothetical protein
VKPYIKPGTFIRKWKYLVEIKERPPAGWFGGSLTVKSPWDPDETRTFNVVGQLQSGLRAFPAVVNLDRSDGGTASVLVVCGSPTGKLEVEMERPPRVALIVEEDGGAEPRRVHRMAIRLGTTNASGDVRTKVTIRQRETAEEVTVPVVVASKHQVRTDEND